MKKFNRAVHKSMGQLPPALRQLISDSDVATATAEFNEYMTALATDFHSCLATDIEPADIELKPSKKLFGQTVSLDYVASGSIGSVINSAKQQIAPPNPVLSAVAHEISGVHDK